MVMAQLGSGISRSPLCPVFVEGSRSSPTPFAHQPPADVHGRLVQIDFGPADGQAFPDTAAGREHHQRQVEQIPYLRRLAGRHRIKPLLAFLTREGLRHRSWGGLDPTDFADRVDRHRAVSGGQAHHAGDHDLGGALPSTTAAQCDLDRRVVITVAATA